VHQVSGPLGGLQGQHAPAGVGVACLGAVVSAQRLDTSAGHCLPLLTSSCPDHSLSAASSVGLVLAMVVALIGFVFGRNAVPDDPLASRI